MEQSTQQKSVAVIIVNYNAGELLAGNLQRILESVSSQLAVHIFIVDNQSTDASRQVLAAKLQEPQLSGSVTLIEAERNGGFAYGNNQGIKSALASAFNPDYFYLLNPDAYTLPGAIDELIAVSCEFQDKCLLGSTLHDESLIARCAAFRLPGLISEFQRGAHLGVIDRLFPKAVVAMPPQQQPFKCDWVSGAGFFFSKKVQEKIGLMDEAYFLYYEEVDFMRHAGQCGIPVLSVPNSKIVHIAGVSTQIVGGKSNTKPMPVYWYQSWHRFFYKNHSAIYAFLCGMAWVLGRMVNNMLSLIIKHRKTADGHSISRFIKYAVLGRST
ncbi:glycosyltransferase family 2 protein [Nitrincola sp.]|uniref:glycosyltransferase family 2 protein n=1 Tax=Nitrincola sp. TaxID=1926584 RepID=UPI003A8E44F0